MFFKRKLRTSLPSLRPTEDDGEVRDHESQKKQQSTDAANQNRVESDLKVGDLVLMRQERENKLTTTFDPKPPTVTEKHGTHASHSHNKRWNIIQT